MTLRDQKLLEWIEAETEAVDSFWNIVEQNSEIYGLFYVLDVIVLGGDDIVKRHFLGFGGVN